MGSDTARKSMCPALRFARATELRGGDSLAELLLFALRNDLMCFGGISSAAN